MITIKKPAANTPLRVLAGLCLVVAAAATAYELSDKAPLSGDAQPGLRLQDFRASASAIALDCVDGSLSGVTHNPEDGRWYAVVNAPELLVEFDLSGRCLRRIPMPGLDDTEGLAWVDGRRFVVIEEDRYRVYLVTLPASPDELPARELLLDLADLQSRDNSGLEGIAYDRASDRLWLARERAPRALFQVNGLLAGDTAVTVRRLDDWLPGYFRMRDLSGLHHDVASDSLLLLSDKSDVVVALDSRGRVAGQLHLSGLFDSVPQAEGVALSADGTLVVASEPNLLYLYRRGG